MVKGFVILHVEMPNNADWSELNLLFTSCNEIPFKKMSNLVLNDSVRQEIQAILDRHSLELTESATIR